MVSEGREQRCCSWEGLGSTELLSLSKKKPRRSLGSFKFGSLLEEVAGTAILLNFSREQAPHPVHEFGSGTCVVEVSGSELKTEQAWMFLAIEHPVEFINGF